MKILIIRFSSIGDIVLTSPVIRCIKAQLPDAEIHYLTKKQNLPVISANPSLSKVWLYDNNFDELIPQLRKEKFDFIADLHKNLRSRLVIFKLHVPSASFPKLNLHKWMMVQLRISFLPEKHLVDRYFEAVKPLGIRYDGKGLDHFIAQQEEVNISALPAPFSSGYTAFVIGGKHVTKIFPEENVIETANRMDLPVLLLGGPEDRARGERIVAGSGNKILNTCGHYSINQSASLIRQAVNVITNDTGLMHIAAAFRRPIVSIWGNTVPAFGMYPFYPDKEKPESLISEVKGLPCRPCSKIGYQKCPRGHFRCMLKQDIEPIIHFINLK